MEIASKLAALTLASRASVRTFSTVNPVYQSGYTYTPSDSFSTSSNTETPAVSAKPKTTGGRKRDPKKTALKAAISAAADTEPLTLRYGPSTQPLNYFKTKAVKDVEKSKVVAGLLSLSDNWAEMKEVKRQRYFEVFEMARLEYEERAKSEPKMAAEAKAKARKIGRVLAEKEGRPKKSMSAFMYFFTEQMSSLPGKKVAEKMKTLGEKWSNLSAAEKRPYEAKAEKAKAAYQIEFEAWKSK